MARVAKRMSADELRMALEEAERPARKVKVVPKVKVKGKPRTPSNLPKPGELDVRDEAGLKAFLEMAGVEEVKGDGSRPSTVGIGNIPEEVIASLGDDSMYFSSPVSGKVVKGKRTVEIIDEITEVIWEDMDQMCPEPCALKDAACELVRAFRAMSKAVIIVDHDKHSRGMLHSAMKDVVSMSFAMLTAAQNLLAIGKFMNLKKQSEAAER